MHMVRIARFQFRCGVETKYDDSERFEMLGGKVTDHRVLLGLKLHMGDRTLQQTNRDIMSPPANPASPLMVAPFVAFGGL
jgi:hypothetical protein